MIVLAATLAVTACGSGGSPGQTGSSGSSTPPPGSSGGSSGGGSSGSPGGPLPCTETASEIALDAQTPLGFSPAAVLDVVGGERSLSLAWNSGAALYATHARAGSQTTLTFAVEAPRASFVESTGGGCPEDGEAPCIVCDSRLEIAVELVLETEDGALSERRSATLVTTRADTAAVTLDIPYAELAGSYFEQITVNDGYEPFGVHLEAAYGASFPGSHGVVPDMWNGYVAATVKQTGTSPSTGTNTSHGYFPPETGP